MNRLDGSIPRRSAPRSAYATSSLAFTPPALAAALLAAGLLAAGLLAATSCVAPGDDAAWRGTETDSAGVRFVHNPAEGLWAEGEAWTFTETLSIGAPSGDPMYEFGRIAGMDIGPEGRLFVLDGIAGEIRVFDPDGTLVEVLGGTGEGPGELSGRPGGIFATADGRVAVPDMGNQRLNWFEMEGFHHSIRVSYGEGFPVRWDGDDHGNIVVQRRAMGGNEDPELAEGDPLARLGDVEGEERFHILPPARTVWMVGNAPRFKIFATEPTWDLGPSGALRTGMTGSYRVEIRDGAGALHTVVTKEHEARPVRDTDREGYLDLFRTALEGMGMSPGAIERQINGLEFGTTYPAITEIAEGPAGTTLVRGVRAIGDMEVLDLGEEMSKRLGSTTWDVFDEGGRYLGAIQIPPRFTPMVWTEGAVYGRWLDELDRPFVKGFAFE